MTVPKLSNNSNCSLLIVSSLGGIDAQFHYVPKVTAPHGEILTKP